MELKNITHMIFDLGGVIINIDPALTFKALQDYGQTEIHFQDISHPLHLKFEKGEISSSQFRQEMHQLTGVPLDMIDHCWNALLLDVPMARIELIRKLRKHYPLYLLSNTNGIHIPVVNQILERETGVKNLEELFDKVYLSYEIEKRKPDAICFEQVIDENVLNPSTTLFIDDSQTNIDGAQKVGLQTLHIQSPFSINYYLDAIVS